MSNTPIMPKIKTGQKWKLFFNKGNRNNKLIHILAIIEGYIAIKYYVNGQWVYKFESPYFFELNNKEGYLKCQKN